MEGLDGVWMAGRSFGFACMALKGNSFDMEDDGTHDVPFHMGSPVSISFHVVSI